MSGGVTTSMIETIKPQKYNPFTAGPLVAYVLAKENEIKTVRIILTARLNGLEEEADPGKDKGDVCIRLQ